MPGRCRNGLHWALFFRKGPANLAGALAGADAPVSTFLASGRRRIDGYLGEGARLQPQTELLQLFPPLFCGWQPAGSNMIDRLSVDGRGNAMQRILSHQLLELICHGCSSVDLRRLVDLDTPNQDNGRSKR